MRRQISETGLAPESGVWGVGLDEANNRVVIFEDGSAAAEQKVSALRSEYGRDILRTEAGSMPKATVGRYSDVAPWNAGDQIVDSGTLSGCTTGFGVHRDGYWYLLSAGHCGAGFWYNDYWIYPHWNNPLGVTQSGSVVVGGIDSQLILTVGSSCITWGGKSDGPDDLVRYYVTGYFDPPVASTIVLEGSFGGDKIGYITATNATFVALRVEPGTRRGVRVRH